MKHLERNTLELENFDPKLFRWTMSFCFTHWMLRIYTWSCKTNNFYSDNYFISKLPIKSKIGNVLNYVTLQDVKIIDKSSTTSISRIYAFKKIFWFSNKTVLENYVWDDFLHQPWKTLAVHINLYWKDFILLV